MPKLLRFALAVLLLNPSFAYAKTIRTFRVGAWNAGAYDDGKKFTHCAGSASYNSGVIVTVVVNKEMNWGLGLSSPDFNFSINQPIKLGYRIDGGNFQTVTASALSDKRVLIGFGSDASRFQEIMRANLLEISGSDRSVSFNLTDTSKLLPALLDCVNRQNRPPVEATAPPTQHVATASKTTDFKAEATVMVANLLSQAGVAGFRIATQNEIPDMKADAVWVAPDLVGGINVFPAIKSTELADVRSIIIGSAAKSCHGAFFSGSNPDQVTDKEPGLSRMFTTCQIKEKAETTYYMAVPRAAGGIYLITTSASGSELPAKKADSDIRNVVFKVVPKS